MKLKETRMGEYHIEPILSLTSLLGSPYHYGRPSKEKIPFMILPQTKYNFNLIKATIPLKKVDENKSIFAWVYKEETLVDLTK